MKLSDYVAQKFVEEGIRHVFLISGGAIIHCVDSVAHHPQLTYICPQHEQSGAAAADAYARLTGNIGAVMTTSGPGATNLLTSVCNAYFDSIPMMIVTGQVATFRLKPSTHLRQKGFQETDIVSIFKSVTKYAVLVTKAEDIRYELEKAFYLARSGRPGPVLLDLPDDLQRVDIVPEKLRSFVPPAGSAVSFHPEEEQLLSWIASSRRPVLILGAGVRIAKVEDQALALARHFQLPILLTWGAMDLLPRTDPLNMGGLGICGPRSGNFAVQNSDLVIALGTRLSQMITGGKQNLFAPKAKKVMVDIDAQELKKFTANDFVLDLALECDLANFFKTCLPKLKSSAGDAFVDWRTQIKIWEKRYPICPPEKDQRTERVDAHIFIRDLSRACQEGDVILTDAGGNLSWTMQAFEVKKDQRLFSAWNHSPMGFSLPAALGAALASGRRVVCVIGDGGLMMCLAELATLSKLNLPVKIFIFNNRGHGIQKQTLDTWLNSRYAAVDEKTGLSFPDYEKLAAAFSLPYGSIGQHTQIGSGLRQALAGPGPFVCNVEIVENQRITPMLKFGAGLEDLDPKLPAPELRAIMEVSEDVPAILNPPQP